MFSIICLALSTLAVPALTKSFPFDACTLLSTNQGISGTSFMDIPFKPVNNEPLLMGILKDVTFTLKSNYSSQPDQFPVNHFVLELEKTTDKKTEIDTIELYTEQSDSTKVILTSKIMDANTNTGTSSISFSKGNGHFSQEFLGLKITWSVEKYAKSQMLDLVVDNSITIKTTQNGFDFLVPPVIIRREPTALVKEGYCLRFNP